LTVRAHRLISSAKVCIYAGSLVSSEVVALVPSGADVYDSSRMSLSEIIEICRSSRSRGLDVVRVHSGDPSIYGAIREQMMELDREGIDYEVIPGVSSFQAAAAALKAELTAPEVSQTVILTRTSGRTPMPKTQELEELARSRATLCVFLSASKIRELAGRLVAHYGADCPAAIVYRASWPEEEVIEGTLESFSVSQDLDRFQKTTMFIVGRALAKRQCRSRLYDPDFSHGFRGGPHE
jgi:precorrin-4/cobalt-precorrin-4 C11-methyltransferase